MEDDKNKNKNKGNDGGTPPPPPPPPPPPKEEAKELIEHPMTLEEYCTGLGTEGINKYAKTRLESKMKQWGIENDKKLFPKWEELYLAVQNESLN